MAGQLFGISLGEWVQIAVTLVSVIVAVAVLFFRIGRRLERIEKGIHMIANQVSALATYTGGLSKEAIKQFGLVVIKLHRRGGKLARMT